MLLARAGTQPFLQLITFSSAHSFRGFTAQALIPFHKQKAYLGGVMPPGHWVFFKHFNSLSTRPSSLPQHISSPVYTFCVVFAPSCVSSLHQVCSCLHHIFSCLSSMSFNRHVLFGSIAHIHFTEFWRPIARCRCVWGLLPASPQPFSQQVLLCAPRTVKPRSLSPSVLLSALLMQEPRASHRLHQHSVTELHPRL